MKYLTDKKDKYTVLTLQEENLNSLNAPDLKSEFVFLRNEGARNVIFDMNNIQYVDSSGLSAILTANRIWKGYGSFVITNIKSDSVHKLIQISRLESILTLIPTLPEAVDYIYMEEIEREVRDESE